MKIFKIFTKNKNMGFIATLKKTTYFALPFVGLELYGFNLIISMFFFFCFLCLIDTLLGYSIAWTKKIVSSSIGTKGLLNKVIRIFLIAGLVAFLANMSYVIQEESITRGISIIILLILFIRSGFEGISILENIAIIGDKRESAFIKRVISIINGFAGIGKDAIDAKVKRYMDILSTKKGDEEKTK